MTQINQSAPAAVAPKGSDIVKFEPFPASDSYVLAIVGYNYIPEYDFDRTDPVTKKDYVQKAPAVEFFVGTIIGGTPYFAKTWPQQYSISDRANYHKYYTAATGAAPVAGSKVDDMVGKHVFAECEVKENSRKNGSKYKITKVKHFGKVPSALAATATPLESLKAPFAAALAASGEQKEEAPF